MWKTMSLELIADTNFSSWVLFLNLFSNKLFILVSLKNFNILF